MSKFTGKVETEWGQFENAAKFIIYASGLSPVTGFTVNSAFIYYDEDSAESAGRKLAVELGIELRN